MGTNIVDEMSARYPTPMPQRHTWAVWSAILVMLVAICVVRWSGGQPAAAAVRNIRTSNSVAMPTTTTTTVAPTTTTTVPVTTTTAVPTTTIMPPTTVAPSSTVAPRAAVWGYGCSDALAWLRQHAVPGFTFICPGYAQGRQAMTCINVTGICPGQHLIVIHDPCPAAYMNEASNSWVLTGRSHAAIDPYGYCH